MRNRKGIGLLEVVIAGALGSILLLGAWSTLSTLNKGMSAGQNECDALLAAASIVAYIEHDLANLDVAAEWPKAQTISDLELAPGTKVSFKLRDGETVEYDVDLLNNAVSRLKSDGTVMLLGKGAVTGGSLFFETDSQAPIARRVAVDLKFTGDYSVKRFIYPVVFNRMLLYSYHYLKNTP